jgi:hypothetical protein
MQMNTKKLVCNRTEFKNECTICTSLCGLFLTCRGENKASSSCIIIFYTHKNSYSDIHYFFYDRHCSVAYLNHRVCG